MPSVTISDPIGAIQGCKRNIKPKSDGTQYYIVIHFKS